MVIAKLYDEYWNFVQQIDGFSEDAILLEVPKGFKGNVVFYKDGEKGSVYEFK